MSGTSRVRFVHEVRTYDRIAAVPLLPRLRISHLMLWTAVAAFCMAALFGPMRNAQAPGLDQSGFVIVWVLTGATTLTALGVLLFYRWRGNRDRQPGHALLILSSIEFLLWSAFTLMLCTLEDGAWQYWYFDPYRFLNGLLILVFGITMAFGQRGEGWKWLIVMTAFQPIMQYEVSTVTLRATSNLQSVQMMLVMFYVGYFVLQSLFAAVALVAIRSDRKRRIHRHWTHWVGVAPIFLSLILIAVSAIMSILTPTQWDAEEQSAGVNSKAAVVEPA